MNILIADDEPLARERLAALVAELEGPHQVVGEAADGEEALALCREREVDLVLMDIRMPGMDGLEAASRLTREPFPPAVVFVTAYDDHALEAFERQALDYLLKPVRRERLQRALERARTPTRPQLAGLGGSTETPARRSHLTARTPQGVMRLPLEEVVCFRADSKYVAACHAGGELLLDESLKGLEQEFGDDFLRIHRSLLVARRHVAGMERQGDGWRLRVHGLDRSLPISRRHLAAVRRWLRSGGTAGA